MPLAVTKLVGTSARLRKAIRATPKSSTSQAIRKKRAAGLPWRRLETPQKTASTENSRPITEVAWAAHW